MSEGTKTPYDEAKKIADDLLVLLADHFVRLEIAGSLRRKKEFIGDIELVGIPRLMPDENSLFAVEIPPTETVINLMKAFGYEKENGGEKYIKFVSNCKMNVDLFLCTPKTWGCIFMIRTGSADFTHKMVTRERFGGWCPNDMWFFEGRLLRGDFLLDTSEEDAVFREMGLAFVPPEQRSL